MCGFGSQYLGTTMCSAFRTFQGWTALAGMEQDQGVLYAVPISEAMAYLMLRPLLSDVPEDDMCGVRTNEVFPASDKWRTDVLEALTGIPGIQAGDSVWWHCDVVHSVAPVTKQKGWGNIMYIPAVRGVPATSSMRPASAAPSSPAPVPATSARNTTSGTGPDASPSSS